MQQQVSCDVNFEDVNIGLKLSFLKLIYRTWMVENAKDINCVLLKKREIKVIQNTKFFKKIANFKAVSIINAHL